MKKDHMNSQIYARCSIKQRASLNKTTSVVLLSDARGFNFSFFSFSLSLLHSPSFSPSRPKFSYSVSPFTFDCFLLFLRLVWPPALGAFTFPVGSLTLEDAGEKAPANCSSAGKCPLPSAQEAPHTLACAYAGLPELRKVDSLEVEHLKARALHRHLRHLYLYRYG